MKISDLGILDASLTQSLRLSDNQPLLKRAASFLAHSADSWFWLAGLVVVYILGPDDWQREILLTILSIIITAGFVLGLKFLIRKPRPEGEWGKVYRKSDPHSFPSGHAARAALLTVLALMAGHTLLGLILAAWTVLVSLSRIALGIHYVSDVLGGAFIGALSGVLFFWLGTG